MELVFYTSVFSLLHCHMMCNETQDPGPQSSDVAAAARLYATTRTASSAMDAISGIILDVKA